MKRIAIFASGNGSNAENIVKYFKKSNTIKVELIASNNPEAGVIDRGKKHEIKTFVFDKIALTNGKVLKELKSQKIEFIVLAGFLLKIPKTIIQSYLDKIINIHPSLLPLYGGKGMYGMRVHEKVAESKDLESGITIHFVNSIYDAGAIIFQAKCALYSNIKAKEIQKKVHKLEIKFFPRIIESLLDVKN